MKRCVLGRIRDRVSGEHLADAHVGATGDQHTEGAQYAEACGVLAALGIRRVGGYEIVPVGALLRSPVAGAETGPPGERSAPEPR